MSSDPVKVQSHPKLGPVIYDPVAQMGLMPTQIRLFKLSTMSAHTFMRAIVSKDLTAGDASVTTQQAAAIESYRNARASRRKPYCEHCRRHFGSVDFTVCSDCSSIRCTCGTCTCAASSRRRRAA